MGVCLERRISGGCSHSANPKPQNPKPQNPKPQNPKPLNPKPLNPKPRRGILESFEPEEAREPYVFSILRNCVGFRV